MSVDPSDQSRNILRNSEIVLSEMKKLEPAESDVFASHIQEIKVVYEHQDFSLSSSHSRSMYGIRTIVGGRLGFITTNTESEESLRAAAREAQQIARLSSPSVHHQTAPPSSEINDFRAWDPKLAQMTPKEIYGLAQTLVDECRRDKRIAIDRAEFSWSINSWAISSSKDFALSAFSSSCSWFVMGMGKTPTEVTSFDYDGSTVTHAADLDTEIMRSVGDFRDSVLYSLGSKSGKTYRGKVLLHPAAVMDLIGGLVSANCTGIRHQDGMSSWKGKIGEIVASPKLWVYEDPLNASRPDGWSPFDREGVATSRHDLIQNGRLNFVAHNCFSAHREGTKPTGNATGSARGLPGIGFHNLSVGGGTTSDLKTDEELLKALGTGLVIKRFSGNDDPASGHFSGIAKNSWWVENGSRAHPVHEVMVSGNLFEVLKNVVDVGSFQHRLIGGGLAPYILVDGVSVTAS